MTQHHTAAPGATGASMATAADAPAVSTALARLIKAHRSALQNLEDAGTAYSTAEQRYWDAMREAGLDHRMRRDDGLRAAAGVDDAERRMGRLSRVENAALTRLCAYTCQTMADVRAWARHLAEFHGLLAEDQSDLALRALAGLPADGKA